MRSKDVLRQPYRPIPKQPPGGRPAQQGEAHGAGRAASLWLGRQWGAHPRTGARLQCFAALCGNLALGFSLFGACALHVCLFHFSKKCHCFINLRNFRSPSSPWRGRWSWLGLVCTPPGLVKWGLPPCRNRSAPAQGVLLENKIRLPTATGAAQSSFLLLGFLSSFAKLVTESAALC